MPLLGGMQMSYVNGFAYRSVTPVSDDEIPERFQRAEEVFEKKLWREQLREWDEVGKPAAIKTHRALQSVDPDALRGRNSRSDRADSRRYTGARRRQHW